MGPDRPGVVAEWVVSGLIPAEGAHAPAGKDLLAEQQLCRGGRLAVVKDSGPQQVPDVGGQAVDLLLVAVERKRVPTVFRHPEVTLEARSQVIGALLQAVAECVVVPDLACQ